MGWEPDSFLLAEEASQYILLLTSHPYLQDESEPLHDPTAKA